MSTHTHTHTHTHADSNPLLWLTYLISLTLFSCNDDHFSTAPSGYPHQVIHISNTQGTSEQVSSPRGGGPDPKPQPNTPSPVRPPPSWGPALEQGRCQSRGWISGDCSEGTALPTRIPPLRLGSSANDRTPKWNDATLACAGHSPPGRKGPVLLLVREPPRLNGGAVSQKGTWGPAGEVALGHSSLNLTPGLAARAAAQAAAQAQPAGTSRRRALPRAVAMSQRAVRRRLRRVRAALCMCVRACMHACRACINDPSAGSPTETLLRLLLPIESQVWPSFRRPVTARRAGPVPAPGRAAVRGPH